MGGRTPSRLVSPRIPRSIGNATKALRRTRTGWTCARKIAIPAKNLKVGIHPDALTNGPKLQSNCFTRGFVALCSSHCRHSGIHRWASWETSSLLAIIIIGDRDTRLSSQAYRCGFFLPHLPTYALGRSANAILPAGALETRQFVSPSLQASR